MCKFGTQTSGLPKEVANETGYTVIVLRQYNINFCNRNSNSKGIITTTGLGSLCFIYDAECTMWKLLGEHKHKV